MEIKKKCTKCNEYKLLIEYDKAKGRKMGVKSACKQCNKVYYQNNKEKYKQYYQEFINKNPDYQHKYYLKNKLPNSN